MSNDKRKRYQTRSSNNKKFVELDENDKIVECDDKPVKKRSCRRRVIVDSSSSDEEYSSSDEEWKPGDDDIIYEEDDDIEIDDKLKEIIALKLRAQIYENVVKRALEEEERENEEVDSEEEEEESDEEYVEESKADKECKKYLDGLPEEKKKEYENIELEIKKLYKNATPLRYKVLDMDTTISNKANILQKVSAFENMEKTDTEYNKLGKWVNTMKLLPFGKYKDIGVKMSDGSKKILEFLNGSYKKLDEKLYGQYEAKNKLIQIMTQWITNPKSQTTVLALEGPPGVGKTSLIKHGLSQALNLPFSFIALGGANDVSTFVGSSYVYEGSSNGEITNILIKSQCMNPIIFMDELDKISLSEKGKEINGLLTHLTDTTQNSTFTDKYFDGVEFDLSRAFFVFSYNNIKLIDPILRDRLNIIRFKPYKAEDKKEIVKKYIFPELLRNIGLNEGDILLSDVNIKYIIMNFTGMEKGVRNLKRCLEDVVMKLNLIRFVDKDKTDIVFPFDISSICAELPIKLTNEIISNLLKSSFKSEIPDYVRNLYS